MIAPHDKRWNLRSASCLRFVSLHPVHATQRTSGSPSPKSERGLGGVVGPAVNSLQGGTGEPPARSTEGLKPVAPHADAGTSHVTRMRRLHPAPLVLALLAAFALACGDDGSGLKGEIAISGSSTVFLVSNAIADQFTRAEPGVAINIDITGTGGGFERFCDGDTAIQDASRPISAAEIQLCRARGTEFIELPIAYDAVSVVVHGDNPWLSCVTMAELTKMWGPAAELQVARWSDVNPAWPDLDLRLFGPSADSGTFDFFTQHINGEAGKSRRDYVSSDDHQLPAEAVAWQENAAGYFGLAYYLNNSLVINTRVKAIEIDAGEGCIAPSKESVEAGAYPLSRPLFIYVQKRAAERPDVRAFVDFYVANAGRIASDVGYVPLTEPAYALVRARWGGRTAGSLYSGAPPGRSLEQLLR